LPMPRRSPAKPPLENATRALTERRPPWRLTASTQQTRSIAA
jgi:hypothetical protein